jgi:OmcA/MtrC family decaheme c-type cytochrome
MRAFRGVLILASALLVMTGCNGDDPNGVDPDAGVPNGNGVDGGVQPGPAGAGLSLQVREFTLPEQGAPSLTFSITDAEGRAVDLPAEIEAGMISPRFVIAFQNPDGTHTSLYETMATGASFEDAEGTQDPVLGSAAQATFHPRGQLTPQQIVAMYERQSEGVYTFNFPAEPTLAPSPGRAHTAGMWATRTFEDIAYPASATLDQGGSGAAAREVVTDQACNACHYQMQAHDNRRTVGLCLTCHSPQTTDPETGNTMDFRVLVHAIHRGQQPNDPADDPWSYRVVGFRQSMHDYTDVAFAPYTNSVRNCTMCHQGAQADHWRTEPSRAACGSCHYQVNFDTGEGHTAANLPQLNDSMCDACHGPASIEQVHSLNYNNTLNVLFDPPNLEVELDDAEGIAAGQAGTVTFTVRTGGQPRDILASPLSMLRFTVAGGEGGYSGPGAPAPVGYIQSPNYTTAATLADVTSTGVPGQFRAALPELAADTSGTVAIGVEATDTVTANGATRVYPLQRGSVIFRGVAGQPAQPRPEITTAAACDTCHLSMGFHSSASRKGPNYCAFCHNPNNVNDERVPRFEVDPETGEPWSITPPSVQLSVMIHKIHAGRALENPVTLGGFPPPNATNPRGTQHTFAGQFPGDLARCEHCHAAGTYGLPLVTTLPTRVETWTCTEDPAEDTNDLCAPGSWAVSDTEFIPPHKSVCSSCHDSPAAIAHMDSFSAGGVENCAACHGPGAVADVLQVHQPRP